MFFTAFYYFMGKYDSMENKNKIFAYTGLFFILYLIGGIIKYNFVA